MYLRAHKDYKRNERKRKQVMKKREQKSDESLKAWWKLAEDKQSEFCVVNRSLYKRHRILDQVIYQVVLPEERRIKVMRKMVLHV